MPRTFEYSKEALNGVSVNKPFGIMMLMVNHEMLHDILDCIIRLIFIGKEDRVLDVDVVHNGEIGQDELIRKSFVIYRPAFDTIRVKSVKSSSPQVQTEFQRLEETDLIARVHFDLQGLPLGPFRKTITVTTDTEKYFEIYVGIEGTVVGELLLEPNQFFTGFLQVDTPVRRTVTLEKRGEGDLEILKVENGLSIVQTKIVPVESGKKYQIEATCTPTASSPKSIRDVIQIHTNNKKQPILKIPLYGLLEKTTAGADQGN